jgi:hypothetical protein
MRAFFQTVDDFLRGKGIFAIDAPLLGRLRWLLAFLLICGLLYGAVMGTYSGLKPGRLHQLLYSGVKVPLLLLATFGLCLPSFFVLNMLAGLRDDFGEVFRALVATQSCITVALAALAPITAFWYVSCADYDLIILFNMVMFGVASGGAQIVVRRYYRPLIYREPRHRHLLWAWFFLYGFVGIQMGWVLRPFIGNPEAPVAFFRAGAWGNAYVVVGGLILKAVERLAPTPLLAVLWIVTGIWLVALIVVLHHVVVRRSTLGNLNQSPSRVAEDR